MTLDLAIKGLWAGPKSKPSVRGVDLTVRAGEFCVLAGPNGSGKSTLLRATLGLAPRLSGEAFIGDVAIARLSARSRARQIGYLGQKASLAWPISVIDLVALGRWARDDTLVSRASAIQSALQRCQLLELATRRCDTLSGGELARGHVARLLVSDAPILIADEPTSALDPAHAVAIMGLLKEAARRGVAVLMTSHDLALAAQFADVMGVLHHGELAAFGAPRAVLSRELVRSVYGVSGRWIEAPEPVFTLQAVDPPTG